MAVQSERGVNLQQGEAITLFASAVRAAATAGTNGTAVYVGGERRRFLWLLSLTNAAAAAGDTLDVYVDYSLDNTTYYNGVHFTQILGNGADTLAYFTVCDPTAGLAADVNVTADAAVNTTRPALFGPWVRGRYVLVDGGAHGQTFTFSLTGYAE